MRILLVGEYSRLHNSLKEGLLQLGHEVTIIGTGDGFKNYPVDLKISSRFLSNKVWHFFAKIAIRLGVDLIKLDYYFKFKHLLPQLKGYDIVQFINETSMRTYPSLEMALIQQLLTQNGPSFLLSCGTDYTSVKYANDDGFNYSILSPLKETPSLKKQYEPILKYLTPPYKKLHNFLYDRVQGVIATDLDYHIPLLGNPSYLGMIPYPINTDKLSDSTPQITDRIHIFHGINRSNYIKKGNGHFDAALDIIEERYPDKVKITRVENVPYETYIQLYKEAHILMDQAYSYDQGYNALEAMASGKVVFTGAEQEWLEYFDLAPNTVAINALPNTTELVKTLEWLILHPEKITEIGKNARAFVEREHHFMLIAKKYLDIWNTQNE